MKIKNGILTSVFDSDISLSGTFVVPSEVRVIGFRAFFLNASVREVVLHDRVREIDEFAFGGCVNLEKIEIHKGVKSIGEYAFYGCISLKSIYLPTSIKKIGKFAFYRCDNLSVYTPLGVQMDEPVFGNSTRVVWIHDFSKSAMKPQAPKIIDSPYPPRSIPPKSQLESNAGLFLGLSPAKTLWDKLVKLFARRDDGSLPLPNRRKWTTDQYYQQVNLWLDNHITTKRK